MYVGGLGAVEEASLGGPCASATSWVYAGVMSSWCWVKMTVTVTVKEDWDWLSIAVNALHKTISGVFKIFLMQKEKNVFFHGHSVPWQTLSVTVTGSGVS